MNEKTTTQSSVADRRRFLKTVTLGGAAVISLSALPKIVEKAGWALGEPRAISAQVSINLGYKKPKATN